MADHIYFAFMPAANASSGIPMSHRSHLSQKKHEPGWASVAPLKGRVTKVHLRAGEKRSGLLALMEVLAILAVVMVAKLGAAIPLLHLAH